MLLGIYLQFVTQVEKSTLTSDFGGREVECWPLEPKFEAVGFSRAKKSSALLPSEKK
jgi:hypothetical protein